MCANTLYYSFKAMPPFTDSWVKEHVWQMLPCSGNCIFGSGAVDPISLLVLVLVLVGRLFKKAQDSMVSNWIGMKVNMRPLTETDFWWHHNCKISRQWTETVNSQPRSVIMWSVINYTLAERCIVVSHTSLRKVDHRIWSAMSSMQIVHPDSWNSICQLLIVFVLVYYRSSFTDLKLGCNGKPSEVLRKQHSSLDSDMSSLLLTFSR